MKERKGKRVEGK